MSDTTVTTTPPTTTPPPVTTTPPAPWHTGIDTEIIGHAQNKGWKLDDPKEAFGAAAKVARDLERHFGVPPEQLLKMPRADSKPEEIAAMWQRLGAPKEAKEYDFSGIKFAGADLEPAFADAMRAGLAAAFVPKDKAGAIVQSVVKYLESADSTESTVNAAALAEERGKLESNWGGKDSNTYRFNMLQAKEGANRLGLDPNAVAAFESQLGYSKVMDALRRIGNSKAEDILINNENLGGSRVVTREGAISRKAELFADKAWGARFNAGDAEAKKEWKYLNQMIDGENA